VTERARLAFNVYDRNRDGYLTKAELRKTSKKMTEAQVIQLKQKLYLVGNSFGENL